MVASSVLALVLRVGAVVVFVGSDRDEEIAKEWAKEIELHAKKITEEEVFKRRRRRNLKNGDARNRVKDDNGNGEVDDGRGSQSMGRVHVIRIQGCENQDDDGGEVDGGDVDDGDVDGGGDVRLLLGLVLVRSRSVSGAITAIDQNTSQTALANSSRSSSSKWRALVVS